MRKNKEGGGAQSNFLEAIIRKSNTAGSFLLANAKIQGLPIVYSSDKFTYTTGYTRGDVLFKSISLEFMAGPKTDNAISMIENGMEKQETFQVDAIFYKRSGAARMFQIQCIPIRNHKEEIIFYTVHLHEPELKSPMRRDGPGRFGMFSRSSRQTNPEDCNEDMLRIPERESKTGPDVKLLDTSSQSVPAYIILHYGTFKQIWGWFILLLTFYTAMMVPYSVAFNHKDQFGAAQRWEKMSWLVIDSMVDVIFIADVVINFMTSIVSSSGEVIMDPKIIRMNYVSNWFSLDLLSCLPYDLINYIISGEDDEPGTTDGGITSLFSALKVARLLRVARVARKLDHFAEYSGVMLILLVCAFGLFGHWLACLWYSIGIQELCNKETGEALHHSWLIIMGETINKPFKFDVDCNWDCEVDNPQYDATKLESDEEKKLWICPSSSECYSASLYFVMTSLTSVGFGNVAANTAAEQIFCVCMLIFGALLYATIFGNVTTIIQQIYADTNRYHDMLSSVREFMRLYQIPHGLRERIMDYIVSTWTLTKGIDTQKVLSFCPKDLRADICVHLNRRVFNDHDAFRYATDSCLRALALEFTTCHMSPGDIVYHKGESVDELNFIISGSLEIIQDDEVVGILSNGDVFGDDIWLKSDLNLISKSAVYVRALTYTDLHVIKRSALNRVLGFYQQFRSHFQQNMRLTYNLRRYHKIRKTPRPGLSKILADIEEDPASDKARSSQLNLRRRKSNISKSSAEAEIRRGSKKSTQNQSFETKPDSDIIFEELDVRNLEHRSDFLTARGSTDAIDGSLLDQDPEHAEKKTDSIFSPEEVEKEENVEEEGNLKEEAIHVNCICKQLHEDNLSLNKRLDELMSMIMEMKSGRQTAFGRNADSRANDGPTNLDVLPDTSESRISAADTEM